MSIRDTAGARPLGRTVGARWPPAAAAGAAADRHHRVLAVGLRPAARLPEVRRRVREGQSGLRINISQYGWDDYWSKLTAGFIADTAPDVFTDHLSKFAQYVDLKVLRPLDDLAPTSDIHDGDYQDGLAELWKGQDGKRYGAPKDWDTIGHVLRQGRRCRRPGSTRPSWRASAGTRATAAPSRSWSRT